MTLTTRCPNCGTLFKLVRDQLKISDGWVRCGVCAEVFDAGVAAPFAESAAALPDLPPVIAARPAGEVAGRVEPVYLPSEPVAVPTRVAGQDNSPAPEPPALTAVANGPERQAVFPSSANAQRQAMSESADLVLQPSEPEFLQVARRRGFWRSRSMHGLLLLLSVALLGLLSIQVALKEHDRLATQFPQLTPYLNTLCRYAGCQLAPLRQIDAVVIDSSGFSKTESGGYQLSFVLKNTASTPLAVPALELTLTDRQDQPVLRRVVLPAEFGATFNALQPRADFSGRLLLNLNNPVVADNIAGYRVLAFYP